jgi:hypothetical protein
MESVGALSQPAGDWAGLGWACRYIMSNSKVFFFEKKKQKTFICFAAAFPERLGPDA